MPLGNGPVSWGVDFADQPDIPRWETVFGQIAEAGYTWAVLGPLGYVPSDHALVRERFESWGLRVAGSFIFEPLHDPAALVDVLRTAEKACSLIAGLGGSFLVVIDRVSSGRALTAGRSADAARLDAAGGHHLVAAIEAVADVASGHGLTSVLHPHAGSYVEFDDEIDAVLGAVDPERLSLCIDTGHSAYAGVDPAALLERHGERVRYVHFKDVDAGALTRVLAERVPFFEALSRGVFCALGDGGVDFPRFVRGLRAIGYDGPGTVEQDRRADTPGDPLSAAIRSLHYLRSAGIEVSSA